MNDIFLQYMLAAMVSLVPPGQSKYSVVPVDICDETCQTTPSCDDDNDLKPDTQDLWCKTPQPNNERYELMLSQSQEKNISNQEEREEYAKLRSFVRYESAEEGLARYYIIAMSIKDSANQHNGWSRSWESLAWSIMTVSSFESNWRNDVQTGTGLWGRGDCFEETYFLGKYVHPDLKTKNGKICKSLGITQANFLDRSESARKDGKIYISDNGVEKHLEPLDVVGLDYQSIRNATNLAAYDLSRSDGACRAKNKDWAWGMFSNYGGGSGCKIASAEQRALRFNRWNSSRKPLPQKYVQMLESPRTQELISIYLNSNEKILWVPVDKSKTHKQTNSDSEKIATLFGNNHD